MGGTLEMTSQLKQGSRFWFTLEFVPQEHPLVKHIRVPLRSHMAGNRLLVVDDNPTNLHLISRHAKAWGMNPTAVSDGLAGLEHLREGARTGRPFGLAVVDQHMPNLDGVGLLHAIAADAHIPPVKVVLLTSGSYHDDRHAENAGAAALLPKPIGPSQLYNCLLQLVTPDALPPIRVARWRRSPPRAAAGSCWPRTTRSTRWSQCALAARRTADEAGHVPRCAPRGLEYL